MESRQFLDVKIQRKSRSATRTLRGSKYQICSEKEEEKRRSPTKAATLLKRCNKYLRYQETSCVFCIIIIIIITIIIIIIIVNNSNTESLLSHTRRREMGRKTD